MRRVFTSLFHARLLALASLGLLVAPAISQARSAPAVDTASGALQAAPASGTPHAQALTAQPQGQASLRSLHGHTFLKNALVPTPFIMPYLSSSLEGAYATIQAAGSEADIKAAGLTPSFLGQFNIGDRVGIELGVGFAEIIGADSYSALVLGADFSYSFSAAIRLPVLPVTRESRWQLTPVLRFGYQKGSTFSPINAVLQGISTQAAAITKGFLVSSSTVRIEPGLLAGVALTPTIGATAELTRIFATATSAGVASTDGSVRAGVGLSADLRSAIGLPIGLTAAYRNDWPLSSSESATPIVSAGLVEVSHRDFNFGIELTRLLTSTPTLSGILSMTYYY